MKKIFVLLITIVLVCSNSINAATKQDILDFVNTQNVGDSKTFAVFNSYKMTFTRLLKQKYLTPEQCDSILYYLTSSVNILNSKGVTKLSDLKKLTKEEKEFVYDALSTGAGIITNAPALDSETGDGSTSSGNKDKNNSESKTTVSINTSDGAMEIYENGVLIDKISTSTNKFTYTGPNKIKINIIVFSVMALLISVILFCVLSKKQKNKFNSMYKIMLSSCIFCFLTVILFTTTFGKWIDKAETLISMLKFNSSDETISVELNSDKTIKKYPSYGNNYARLIINNLGIDRKIVYGDDASLLSNNVGQSTWSDLPTEGGLTVLSGHNREDMLKDIEKISIGEEILIDASYATCKYIVNKIDIVTDTTYEALTKNTGKETLIIYTCYPFSEIVYGNKRFVVYANLDEIQWK